MKKYKFHLGYPPHRDSAKEIEAWLEYMQDQGWEFMGLSPAYISSGYTQSSGYYIFRREEKICTPDYNPNSKE